MAFSKKDLQILSYLRSNSRMPLTKMSRMTGIPVSTLFDRVKQNEANVVIKHTALLDFAQLGYFTRANIALKVERDDKENLKDFLLKQDCLNSVCRINNGYDFMAEGIFRQIGDMENFIESVEERFKLSDKKIFFIIEDLKKESFLSTVDDFKLDG